MAKSKHNTRCVHFLQGVELMKAVEAFIASRNLYQAKIIRAEIDANILATEYYVCAGIGFTKYLN